MKTAGKMGALLLMLTLTATAWAGNTEWKTDFDQAKALAKSEHKYLLINFTGSDWCPWCVKLRTEVFQTPEFNQFVDSKLVLMEADFPRTKSQPAELKAKNRRLAGDYGIEGFPTVLLLNPQGEVVAKTGYRRGGAGAYVDHLKAIIQEYEQKQKK